MSTVYILGAGATKAVAPQAPLMDNFLPLAFQRFSHDDRIKNVREFVSDFYLGSPLPSDGRVSQAILPRLEDVLSQLDLCVVNRRPLSAEYPLQKVQKLREDLVYLIACLLRDTLEGEREIHTTVELVHSLTEEDAIISLNYDIIVDNTLVGAFGPWRVDYGVDIRLSYYEYPNGLNEPPRAHQAGPPCDLYKLHGSLNWLYCPNCQALDVTLAEKGALRTFNERDPAVCLRCHLSYEALIITPTLLKDYANGLLLQVWRKAEERITRADQVVFIGYSLADADVQIKCMIKRATYNCWSQRGQRPTVTVVDKEGEGTEAKERYRRLFGEVEYLPIGFVRYVQEHIG